MSVFWEEEGYTDLTERRVLPALDFMRSDLLTGTATWRTSDIMDSTETATPIPGVLALIHAAQRQGLDLYVFGREYTEGNDTRDTHMNQRSRRAHFLHRAGDDSTDHTDIWQDGALMIGLGGAKWAAYFAAFEQQAVPTDALGNPLSGAGPIT